MRDVGADELCRGEPIGIEIDEHHDAERPGADGRQRDQEAEQRAGGDGKRGLRVLERVRTRRAQILAEAVQRALEQHRDAGQ